MQTLLLDQVAWDLVVDANGNIALASDPYSDAQDIASACRLFQGELYYDTTQGVPYFASILGKRPPLAAIKADYVKAAQSVPLPAGALVTVFLSSFQGRTLSGNVQVRQGTVTATVVF